MVKRDRITRTITPADYLRLGYRRIVRPDPEGGFAAKVLEFPGCFSQGETVQEAYDNLEEAAADWIRAALRQGQTIPQPLAGDSYSGNIMLRLPCALHERAAELAELDRTSLNQFLVSAVAERVGATALFNNLEQRLMTIGGTASPTTIHIGVISLGTTSAAVLASGNTAQGTFAAVVTGAAFGAGVAQYRLLSNGSGEATLSLSGIGTSGTITSTGTASLNHPGGPAKAERA